MTREDIINRISQLRAQKDAVQEDIDALERAVKVLYPPDAKRRTGGRSYTNVSVDDINGMGIEDAARHIAAKNNNELISTPARKLMEQAGVLPVEGSGTHLYQALKDSRFFEQTGTRGRWVSVESRAALKAV